MERVCIGPRVMTEDGLLGAHHETATCFEVYAVNTGETLGVFDTAAEARAFARAIASFEGVPLDDCTRHYE